MKLRDALHVFSYMGGEKLKEENVTENTDSLVVKKENGSFIKLTPCLTLQEKIETLYGDNAIAFITEDQDNNKEINVFSKDEVVLFLSMNMNDIAQGRISIFCEWLDDEETFLGKTKVEVEELSRRFEEKEAFFKNLVKEDVKEWHEYRMYFATQDIAFEE